MNHLEKRIKEKYPNQDIKVLKYSTMHDPATVQCKNCQSVYTLTRGENFLRKEKKCICNKCKNNHSGGRLSLEDFQMKINKLYPNQSLTVLNYTLKNRPCTIKCNTCGQEYTLKNAQSFYNKNKKRVCKNCLPNKRNIIKKSIDKFMNWVDTQDAFVFKDIPEKINSKTLITGYCTKCGKPSEKNIYENEVVNFVRTIL